MKKFKRILIIFMLGLILSSNLTLKAESGVPYTTYTEDSRGRLIPTQDAYIALSVYKDFLGQKLSEPSDLFLDKNDTLYIADAGNKRILIIEKGIASVRSITYENFIKPTGVFVSDNLDVYVADPNARAVFMFDKDGNFLQKFEKPTSILFGTETSYSPQKVVVDKRGNLYIVSNGNYNGLIQINKYGEFLGYFGANSSQITFRQKLIKEIFPKEIVSQYFKVVPLTPFNLAIDNDGLIYTITRGATNAPVRKLNIGGTNKISKVMNTSNSFSDITVGPIGNMYTVDDSGLIYEYDTDGNLLFCFGGKDNIGIYKGLLNTASGIVVDKNYYIYVVDSKNNELHVFMPTEFATLVHEALDFYQQGLYIESKEPWEKVLEYNYMFDLAHKGIGQAYFKEGKMEEAMERFKMIGDMKGYSNAYWEVRNEWLVDNLTTIFIIIGVLFVLGFIYSKLFKKKVENKLKPYKEKFYQKPLVAELTFALKIRKKPTDVMQDIQRDRGITLRGALILYVLAFIVMILKIYFTGPSFSNRETQFVSLFKELFTTAAPIALFIIANYMIATITEGQGKFMQVLRAAAVCLIPYIILTPVNTILSNFLTQNEIFIYNIINTITIAWVLLLVFLMVKDLHNYSFWGTVGNILLTLFAFAVFAVAIMLLNNVLGRILEFVVQIFKEVFARG